MNFTGIIMAGGKSSRMGYDKGLTIVNGKRMIKHVNAALSTICNKVIIIANTDVYDFLGLPVYEDLIKEKGPLAGIYTALKYSDTDDNIIVACDMPFVSESLLKLVIQHKENKEIVVPKLDGFMEPLCGYYKKSIVKKLEDLLSKDVLSVHQAIQHFDHATFDLENQVTIESRAIANINSEADLKKLTKP